METSKARQRRQCERFFDFYCVGKGIDIGCGDDPLASRYGTVQPFDREHGDATLCDTLEDESFDFVYASHVLEHLREPDIAVRNWFRILKPNGFLIISVPHRDLYEKREKLPSRWNIEHVTFWLPDKGEGDTKGLREFIDSLDLNLAWEYCKVCDEDYSCTEGEHPEGEYSIEMVARKCSP